jgi:hypothetical protein
MSGSTVTHATIVRGASVVRRVQASTITSPQRGRRDGIAEENAAWDAAVREEAELTAEAIAASRRSRSPSPSSDDEHNSDSDSPSPGHTVSTSEGEGDAPPPPPPKPPKLVVSTEKADADAVAPADTHRAVFSPRQGSTDDAPALFVDAAPGARPTLSIVPTSTLAPTLSPHGSLSTQRSVQTLSTGLSPNSATTFSPDGPSPSPPPPSSPRMTGVSRAFKPLAAFIDGAVDPRAKFADLTEIAQGESGSVFSARVVGAEDPFAPPVTPSSPYPRGGASPRSPAARTVALKIVPAAGNAAKLASLRRELELVRGVRHPNVLRFERVFVDLPGEAAWLGMELMERSLADVLALRDAEGLEDAERRSVRVGERVIARFVWDVRLA